jgi:hypothetical protein
VGPELENIHRLRDQGDRLVGGGERGGLGAGQRVPEVPQGLAQALPRLLLGNLAPEQGGEGVAGVGPRPRRREISQERAALLWSQRDRGAISHASFKASKEDEVQPRHRNLLSHL